MAKIIPLKKSGKSDYAELNIFRRICLLFIFSKAIEAIIAKRIRYQVEKYSLLPLNHYEALKQKTL